MPKCIKCGFWDETDAEFDNTRTLCDGCIEKMKEAARSTGYTEYQLGEYTVLEKSQGDSCGYCGSHGIHFYAWKGGDFCENMICSSCDSVEDYLYPTKRTIVMEHGENILARVESHKEMGGKMYRLVSYEIWTDREKFNQNIPAEFNEDGQYIYCSNYATNNEQSMIDTFKSRFKIK